MTKQMGRQLSGTYKIRWNPYSCTIYADDGVITRDLYWLIHDAIGLDFDREVEVSIEIKEKEDK